MHKNRILSSVLITSILVFSTLSRSDEDMEGMRFMMIETDGLIPPAIVVKTVKAGVATAALVGVCFVGWKYRRNILKDLALLKNDTAQIKADTSVLKNDTAEIKDIIRGIKKDTSIIERDVKNLQSSIDTHASVMKQRLFALYRRFIKMNKDIEGIRNEGTAQATKIDVINQKVESIDKKQDEMLTILRKIAQRSEL
jgi:hypothetical protein